jgi:hypothetical protein
LKESVTNLQSRSQQLRTAQTRQLELEQELTRSLARSRTQLSRLTAHGSVLSAEEIAGRSAVGEDPRAQLLGDPPESSATVVAEELVSGQPVQQDSETNLSLRANPLTPPNQVNTQPDNKQTELEFGTKDSSPVLEEVPNVELIPGGSKIKPCAICEIPEHERLSLFGASKGNRPSSN